MSIHDIIHTDSSAVTAWLKRHAAALFLFAVAACLLAFSVNLLRDVDEAQGRSELDALIHQGKVGR